MFSKTCNWPCWEKENQNISNLHFYSHEVLSFDIIINIFQINAKSKHSYSLHINIAKDSSLSKLQKCLEKRTTERFFWMVAASRLTIVRIALVSSLMMTTVTWLMADLPLITLTSKNLLVSTFCLHFAQICSSFYTTNMLYKTIWQIGTNPS
jgi:hypothetical protein